MIFSDAQFTYETGDLESERRAYGLVVEIRDDDGIINEECIDAPDEMNAYLIGESVVFSLFSKIRMRCCMDKYKSPDKISYRIQQAEIHYSQYWVESTSIVGALREFYSGDLECEETEFSETMDQPPYVSEW